MKRNTDEKEAAGAPMNQSNDRRSLGMLIASMLIWGTIGLFRRFIPVSSAFLAFARGVLGGLFLLIFLRLNGKHASPPLPKRVWLGFVLIGVLIGFNWMLLFEAYNHTTVAIATLCYYMQPTIVLLLSPVFFRERLTVRKAVCAAFSILGMLLISGAIGAHGAQSGGALGVLLGLGAAALYAAVVILNKKIPGGDAYQRTTVQLLSAGIVMIPYLLLTDGFRGMAFDPSGVLLLLAVGILHTGIAYVLYFTGMRGLRVQTIAMCSYIDPVSALLVSALFLGESLTPLHIIGAVLIIGSALISQWGGKHEGEAAGEKRMPKNNPVP